MSEEDKFFWKAVGQLFADYRHKSGNYNTQQDVADELGLESKSSVSDIENGRNYKKGLRAETIENFQVLLDIPQEEITSLCKKYGKQPFLPFEPLGSRLVYLSEFDLDNGPHSNEIDWSFRSAVLALFIYGAMADVVTFQFSAPLKMRALSQAIPVFKLAFQVNEKWEKKPLFSMLRSEETPYFSDYLSRRRSFLKAETDNPEVVSYEKSGAKASALSLDEIFLETDFKYKKKSIGRIITTEIRAYFQNEDRRSKTYQLIYPYWTDPTLFQTFRVKSEMMDHQNSLSVRGREFLGKDMRVLYHRANAQANSSFLDTDTEWRLDYLASIFHAFGVSDYIYSLVEGGLTDEINRFLFRLRAHHTFCVFKNIYFESHSGLGVKSILAAVQAICLVLPKVENEDQILDRVDHVTFSLMSTR